MKKTRIVIIANGIIGTDPALAGGDARIFEIMHHWQNNKNIQIELLSSQSAQQIIDNHNLNIKLHIISNLSDNSQRFAFIFRTIQVIFKMPSSLNNFNNGVIYSANDSLFDVISAYRLKRKNSKKIKWVALIHLIPPSPFWKRKNTNLFNAFMFFVNQRLSLFLIDSFADKIFAVSDSTTNKLIKINIKNEKIFTTGCGINFFNIKKLSSSVEKKYDAVFMKRFQIVKGALDLIKIWEKVIQYKKDAKLLVIGDIDSDGKKIIELINKKGLNKNIFFTGYIYNFNEKIKTLASGKIFLHPSYEENWSIALAEAISANLPVFAYQLDELIDVWQDNINWIPLGDIEFFVEKILDYYQDPDKYITKVKKSANFIKKFNWKKIATDELKMILKI